MIYFFRFNNQRFITIFKKEKIKFKINKNKDKVNNFYIISNGIPDKFKFVENDILLSLLCPTSDFSIKYTGILANLYFSQSDYLSTEEYINCINAVKKEYLDNYWNYLNMNKKNIYNKIDYILQHNNNIINIYTSMDEMPFDFTSVLKDFLEPYLYNNNDNKQKVGNLF